MACVLVKILLTVTTTNPKMYIDSNLIEGNFSHPCAIKASPPDVKDIPHKVMIQGPILNLYHHQWVARSPSFLAPSWKKEKRAYGKFSCTSPGNSWPHFHLPIILWHDHASLQGSLGSIFHLFTQKGKKLFSRIHGVSAIMYEVCYCCRIKFNERERNSPITENILFHDKELTHFLGINM